MESTLKIALSRHFFQPVFLILLICFSTTSHSQTSKVEASIDKNPVMLDESFTLTVTANGDVERDEFDSSALLSSFVVGRTSVSSQTRMINFQTTRSTTWSTSLFPRSTGEFTIPAFQIDGQSSQPIVVSVIPVSAGSNSESRDVFVTTELEKETVYLHQQVKYSVKLYLAREIERGSLQAPNLSNAEIQQVGKDAEYSEILNGKRYRVIERDFVIIPQRSGEFTINGPIFQGDVVANSRQSFGFFNRTQSVSRVGPAQKLNVLAIPDTVSGTFLPSEFVDLHQEWSTDPQEWRVGEPVTRTITLTAVGLTESLLPEINDIYPPDIKTYPDQANTTTAENEQSIVAQRIESIALIPSRAGRFVIPPVEVEWFNVATESIETAELPGMSVTVLPAANTATNGGSTNPNLTDINQNATPLASQLNSNNSVDNASTPEQLASYAERIDELETLANRWRVAAFSLIGLLIVIGTVYGLSNVKSPREKSTKTKVKSDSEHASWKHLIGAIDKKDAIRIKAALLTWLQQAAKTQSTDLNSILRRLDQQAMLDEVNSMFASQYAGSTLEWRSDGLHAQLKELRNQLKDKAGNSVVLKPLYPA